MRYEISKKKGMICGFIFGYIAAFVLLIVFVELPKEEISWRFIHPIPVAILFGAVGWFFPRTMSALAFLVSWIQIT